MKFLPPISDHKNRVHNGNEMERMPQKQCLTHKPILLIINLNNSLLFSSFWKSGGERIGRFELEKNRQHKNGAKHLTNKHIILCFAYTFCPQFIVVIKMKR